MSFTASNAIFSVVKAPEAKPPVSGLLACLAGTEYLIDDSGTETEPGFDGRVTSFENRWMGGVAYAPEQMGTPPAVSDPCSQAFNMDAPANLAQVQAMPFVCWAGDTCSSFGWEARDFKGRATRALLAGESYQIAKEFWGGAQAQSSGWPNNYLTEPALLNVVATTAQTPSAALNLLEQAIADTSGGQQGMIHCTRQLGSALSELGNTFHTLNGLTVTYTGTVICMDAGYPGTGPTAHSLGGSVQWAYATLMPTVRRSPIDVVPGTLDEAMNRSTNLITWRAERLAVVTVPPCTIVGCPITLTLPTVGS